MLNSCHFQVHDLMRVKVTGLGLPITLIAPGLDLSLTVAPDLVLGVLAGGQVWAPPIILQMWGGLLFVMMSLGYEN